MIGPGMPGWTGRWQVIGVTCSGIDGAWPTTLSSHTTWEAAFWAMKFGPGIEVKREVDYAALRRSKCICSPGSRALFCEVHNAQTWRPTPNIDTSGYL